MTLSLKEQAQMYYDDQGKLHFSPITAVINPKTSFSKVNESELTGKEVSATRPNAAIDKKISKLTELTQLAQSSCELWHDENQEPYASFNVAGHFEHWSIDSKGFKDWLSRQAFIKKMGSVSKEVMADTCATLGGLAKYEGATHATGWRVMKHDGAYWIDIANDTWQAIKISSAGWQIVDNPPVRFLRNKNFRPLPTSISGGKVTDLFELINVPKEDELLVLAWMMECYRPDTQYPILELNGEQGSAKSTTQRVLRLFIDNNKVMLRARPKAIEDIYVAVSNGHLISYENLSGLSADMSDALCVVSTGGGYAARTLYTNTEETTLSAKNPVIINGINRVITRPDLLDRAITISCPLIKQRIDEIEHQKMVEALAPTIFGALLDLFVKALQILPTVSIDPEKLPRMTAFTYLGEAMSQALGKKDEDYFVDKYVELRREAVAGTIDATPLGRALLGFVECGHSHIGTVGNLLARLNAFEHKASVEPGDFWPKSPRKLGDELRRLAPALRQIGIDCTVDSKPKRDGIHCAVQKKQQSSPR